MRYMKESFMYLMGFPFHTHCNSTIKRDMSNADPIVLELHEHLGNAVAAISIAQVDPPSERIVGSFINMPICSWPNWSTVLTNPNSHKNSTKILPSRFTCARPTGNLNADLHKFDVASL